ncbi:MAG: hypothetical protein P1U58_07965 [Verrucomicrobiales bacterium]|nr:hypothetical protein [Verrucomicrobiales bacterium]
MTIQSGRIPSEMIHDEKQAADNRMTAPDQQSYQAPDIELELTDEALEMEQLYAGQVIPVGSMPNP